jgi:hypothetical protein
LQNGFGRKGAQSNVCNNNRISAQDSSRINGPIPGLLLASFRICLDSNQNFNLVLVSKAQALIQFFQTEIEARKIASIGFIAEPWVYTVDTSVNGGA